MMDIKQKDKFT